MSDEVKDTIKNMAQLVVNSNKISDVHVKTMTMWPLIYFEGVSEAKIDYDLSHIGNVTVDKTNNITVKSPIRNNFVSYYLTIDERPEKNTYLDRRFAALEDSTRGMFWKDLPVKIYFNGKLRYQSK